MTATTSRLASYVGAQETEYGELLADCLAEAQALVDQFNRKRNPAWDGTDPAVEQYVPSAAPEAVVDRAVIEVGADLFNRRNAPNGIVNGQFANYGGDQAAAVRINRDPMAPAYPILRRWVGAW